MMRRAIALLLALTLLVAVTACGKENTTPADDPVSTGEAESTDATETTAPSVPNDEPTTTEGSTDASAAVTTGSTREATEGNKSTSNKSTTVTTKKVTTTTKASSTTKKTDADVTGDYVTINGSSKNLKTWVYQMADSGVCVREARFDSGKGGDPVTIVQITDIHIGTINDKDRQENNAALMWTYNKRKGAFSTSVANITRCMEYASQYDQTILTGDTIDYLSWGNLEAIHKYVWDKDPNALVTLGNHDATRTMSFPDQIKDETTLASRYAIVQSEWKHDIYYTSKVLKNKVMVIQMDDSQHHFWPEQLPKLKADLEKAKENGYVVLLFMHLALKTGVAGRIQSFCPNTYTQSFNSAGVYNGTKETEEIYSLITNNADIVKGVFCGDEHYNFYMEIKAKTSDGKDAVIPQYVLTSSTDKMGFVLKITVK